MPRRIYNSNVLKSSIAKSKTSISGKPSFPEVGHKIINLS